MRFVKATLVRGVSVLIPLVVIGFILAKAYEVVDKLSAPLQRFIPVKSVFGFGVSWLVVALLLVVGCFMLGLLAYTGAGVKAIGDVEEGLLSNIPGYEFFKSLISTAVGAEQGHPQEVVVARIEDSWQIGFLIERLENDHAAVYVPGAPFTTSGSVYFMASDRYRIVDMSPARAMKLLRRLGLRSAGSLDAVLHEPDGKA